MSSLFRGSSQPSNLQQAIEKITDPSQSNEDWGLIMQICDYVESRDESAKEAMKVIRKRLQINPTTHGWNTIVLTLTLLEALIKNCGKPFHLQVAHRDFLKELKNVIGPKNNPPLPIQERVLGMIQTWALAFRHDPDLKAVDHFYQECKQQGMEFPPPEPEKTIKAAVPPTGTLDHRPSYGRSMSNVPPSQPQRTIRSSSDSSAYSMGMTAEQMAKLRSELDVVQTNVQVFGEMLVTLQPGEENAQDFELLLELYKTCQQMQTRIIELLSQITVDEITADLLRHNDELIHSFKTFENYMQERERRCSNRTKPVASPRRNVDDAPALIRFDDEPTTLTTNMQSMQISSSASAIPKHSSSATNSNTRSMNIHSPSAVTRAPAINHDMEREVHEVEQWLKIQGDESDSEDVSHRDGETSAAFNQFLEKRASAGPQPSTSTADTVTSNLYPNMQPLSNRIDPSSNNRM